MTGALLRLALAFLVLTLGIAMLQNHLLYHPEKASIAAMATGGLAPWPGAGDFRGLVAEPHGRVRGTVVVFHGNGGHAGHRGFYASDLNRLGLRVVLAEYPGYGPRPGPLGEKNLVADAEDTILRLREAYGVPLLVIGESLGAGVAAQAAARQRDKVDGLALITPWDRLENIATLHYPWLPVKWLLRDRYETVAHLADFGRPILVVVAARDSIVPARFGVALHDALAGPKRLRLIPGAEHNDWPDKVDEAWWQEGMDFLLSPPGREA